MSVRDWYSVARVRSGPTLMPREDGSEALLFSPELLPHFMHPEVAALRPEQRAHLLRRWLARYLHDTAVLETDIVNPTALEIAQNSGPISFDLETRMNARKIYCDEGYHALVAAELFAEIAEGLPDQVSPAFVRRLDESPYADDPMVRLLFTCTTETLLSSTLRTVRRDDRVAARVRDFVDEHARDEAWHAHVFGEVLAHSWATLDQEARLRLGVMLPDLLHAYLDPDLEAIIADLRAIGLTADKAECVARESWSASVCDEFARSAARPTIACLQRANALALEPVRAAFVDSRLI